MYLHYLAFTLQGSDRSTVRYTTDRIVHIDFVTSVLVGRHHKIVKGITDTLLCPIAIADVGDFPTLKTLERQGLLCLRTYPVIVSLITHGVIQYVSLAFMVTEHGCPVELFISRNLINCRNRVIVII